MKNISLTHFVSKYTKNNKGFSVKRQQSRGVSYRIYDMAHDYKYRREMVTLHIPFRNEDTEILAVMKFTTMYGKHENEI